MLGWLANRFSWFTDRRGTAAVEFALVVPVLLLVTLGVIDTGRMMWVASTLDHAAREGARYARLRGAESSHPVTDRNVEAYVRNRAVGMNADVVSVAVTWSPNNYSGSSVTVRVSASFDFLSIGFLRLEPIRLEGASTMVVV